MLVTHLNTTHRRDVNFLFRRVWGRIKSSIRKRFADSFPILQRGYLPSLARVDTTSSYPPHRYSGSVNRIFRRDRRVGAVEATSVWLDAQADFATQIKRIDHISAVFSMRECTRAGLYRAFSPTTNTIANGKASLDWIWPGAVKQKIWIIIWIEWNYGTLLQYIMTICSVIYFPARLCNVIVIFRIKGSLRYFWRWLMHRNLMQSQ